MPATTFGPCGFPRGDRRDPALQRHELEPRGQPEFPPRVLRARAVTALSPTDVWLAAEVKVNNQWCPKGLIPGRFRGATRRVKTAVVGRATADSPSTNCGADHGMMTSLHTRPARPTLALDQADELLQLVLVEVGDGTERHP